MEQIEIHVDPAAIEKQLTPLLEGAIAHFGLEIRMRGTLRTYPGAHIQTWRAGYTRGNDVA